MEHRVHCGYIGATFSQRFLDTFHVSAGLLRKDRWSTRRLGFGCSQHFLRRLVFVVLVLTTLSSQGSFASSTNWMQYPFNQNWIVNGDVSNGNMTGWEQDSSFPNTCAIRSKASDSLSSNWCSTGRQLSGPQNSSLGNQSCRATQKIIVSTFPLLSRYVRGGLLSMHVSATLGGYSNDIARFEIYQFDSQNAVKASRVLSITDGGCKTQGVSQTIEVRRDTSRITASFSCIMTNSGLSCDGWGSLFDVSFVATRQISDSQTPSNWVSRSMSLSSERTFSRTISVTQVASVTRTRSGVSTEVSRTPSFSLSLIISSSSITISCGTMSIAVSYTSSLSSSSSSKSGTRVSTSSSNASITYSKRFSTSTLSLSNLITATTSPTLTNSTSDAFGGDKQLACSYHNTFSGAAQRPTANHSTSNVCHRHGKRGCDCRWCPPRCSRRCAYASVARSRSMRQQR